MGKVKISAPSNLNEITLRQYQEYQEVENPTERDLLRIFLNLSDSVIDKIPLAEVTRVAGIVANILKQKANFQNIFTLNGVKYGFVPSLDQISYGEHDDATEYLTAVKYIQDGEERVPIPDMKNLHKGLAVLYRRVTTQTFGKYDIEEYTVPISHEEEFRDMPFGVALGALVFFYDLTKDLLRVIPNYFRREVVKEKITHFSQNGEDITDYMRLLEGICSKLTLSLRDPHMSVILSLPTSKTKPDTKKAS